MKRLALLLMLGGCAVDGPPPGPYIPPPSPGAQEAALPPTAHEWDHGPPWEAEDRAWASAPGWATQPATSWAWGGSALGPWVAAPSVSIGIGTGWWWGYRPWPRYGGWWAPAPVWRPYGWAHRPAPWGWRQPGWGGPRYGWGGPRHGWGGHRGGWRR